jgi:hypothetical protein
VFGAASPEAQKSVVSVASAVTGSVFAAAEKGAPQKGTGTLSIEVDADGRVTGVTASSPTWARVASEIQVSLAGRKLRVPSGAKGVRVTYAVDADTSRTSNFLKGDPRVLVPCGTKGTDDVGRVDHQANMTCYSPGVRLRFDVSIRLLGERAL